MKARYILPLVFGLLISVRAFPPAPHHLFYGMIRDEYGNPLGTDAEVFLESGAGVVLRGRIDPNTWPGLNYQLTVPMDAGLTSDAYKPSALRPTLPFKMKVKIGATVYLPIQMTANFATMGQPGQKTRLDLTLGEDADGDGIPDAWERMIMEQSGGTLSGIRPSDDSDRDGMSNLDEYLAGTYAFDDKNGFVLNLVGLENGAAVLQFTAILGRAYSVQGSSDLKSWTDLAFHRKGAPDNSPAQSVFQATDVAPIQIKVAPQGQGLPQFFRLIVQ